MASLCSDVSGGVAVGAPLGWIEQEGVRDGPPLGGGDGAEDGASKFAGLPDGRLDRAFYGRPNGASDGLSKLTRKPSVMMVGVRAVNVTGESEGGTVTIRSPVARRDDPSKSAIRSASIYRR